MTACTQTTTPRNWLPPTNAPSGTMHSAPHADSTTAAPATDIDSACLRAIAAGDRQALAALVDRWQQPLIHFFYRSTHNRADAEDLAQQTFLELYRSATRYQPQGASRAFIFTLARRRLIDHYRKQARRPLDFIDPSAHLMQQQAARTDASAEIEEAFHRALASLPEKQRSAILMRQQQGLAYEEIAQALNASLSSVKSWIHRARRHLRQQLQDFA